MKHKFLLIAFHRSAERRRNWLECRMSEPMRMWVVCAFRICHKSLCCAQSFNTSSSCDVTHSHCRHTKLNAGKMMSTKRGWWQLFGRKNEFLSLRKFIIRIIPDLKWIYCCSRRLSTTALCMCEYSNQTQTLCLRFSFLVWTANTDWTQ